ncbi:MAG: 4Fe-4S binding protein [Firmicutes bacterium]|nr:4Fe-4S binding protein [Bacillota bacterium]
MMKICEECIACGTCQAVCPVEAIEAGDKYKINTDVCLECGACMAACPVGAIVQE